MKRKKALNARSIKASTKSPEERRARKLVRRRSSGLCEIQIEDVCTGRATDWCHRIREGQGGPWSPTNGLHGCRACHTWTHLNPAAARVKRWALKTYDSLTLPVEVRGTWVVLGEDGSAIPSRNGAAA